MDRKIYQLTASDLKKCKTADEIAALKLAFEDRKTELGKKFGLKKRDYYLSLMMMTQEYYQGKGQGALDLASGLPYAEKTDCGDYNVGYHNGFTNPSNLRDLIERNPNFSHLKN